MAKEAPKAKSRATYADAVGKAPNDQRRKKENPQVVNSDKLSPGKGPPEPCQRATPCKREIKRWLQLGPHSGMCDGKM